MNNYWLILNLVINLIRSSGPVLKRRVITYSNRVTSWTLISLLMTSLPASPWLTDVLPADAPQLTNRRTLDSDQI